MRYPEAQWLANGQSGGSYTGGPHRLIIHTTETAGLPSYNNGWSAPHLTYHPGFRAFYQHTDFNVAARALRNEAGGVQTNRRSALQIEIIAYSAKNIADQTISRQWVGDLSDDNYEDLRAFVVWCGESFGVKIVWPGKQALSYAQANAAGFRMTPAEWDGYNGVCGHQHVPENTHWDPGAIDWKKLLPEDTMTPAQEAKLDQALALLAALPTDVWSQEWGEPGIGFPPSPDHVSMRGALVRAYKFTRELRSTVGALDLEGVSEAELDERVAELAAVIAAQPAAFIAKLKAQL